MRCARGSSPTKFMTLSEWLREAESRLSAAHIEDARLEARVLAAHALDIDRPAIIAHGEETVPTLALERVLERRLRREPLAHILGFREFYGRPFRVSRDVLIPRQETEHVVEEALARLNAMGVHALDLGAGSGCIGLTLALERPSWRVTLSDVSSAALDVARANADALGARAEFALGDLFGPFDGRRFDLIVSNPPYIAEGEILMPEVALFEPELALYGGESGYEFYERIANGARDHLGPEGLLIVEIGAGQGEGIGSILADAGWTSIELAADLAGIPRVVIARLG